MLQQINFYSINVLLLRHMIRQSFWWQNAPKSLHTEFRKIKTENKKFNECFMDLPVQFCKIFYQCIFILCDIIRLMFLCLFILLHVCLCTVRLWHECPSTLWDQCSQSLWPRPYREEREDPLDYQRRVRGRLCHRCEDPLDYGKCCFKTKK